MKTFPPFAILSLLLHGIAGYTCARFGSYDFARPVSDSDIVTVELKQWETLASASGRLQPEVFRSLSPTEDSLAAGKREFAPVGNPEGNGGSREAGKLTAYAGKANQEDHEVAPDVIGREERKIDTTPEERESANKNPYSAERARFENMETGHVERMIAGFRTTMHERLTYQVSLFGLPAGSAVLEAVNKGTEIRITSTVRSNAVISGVYPVTDFAETRLIGKKYIVSRVRQREGAFQSDTGFTLCLPERNSVWVDRLRNVVATQRLESADVVDVLSGFYFLRNQPLEVGKTIYLQIFDSNRAVATPVEVLRKERVKLPGFREADTIVIRPVLQTDGLFRRSGDVLIWLTDDANRVPVRLETTIALGKVTAELVSAEVDWREKDK